MFLIWPRPMGAHRFVFASTYSNYGLSGNGKAVDEEAPLLGFEPRISVPEGIREVREALETGLVKDPLAERHENATFIVQ